MHNRCGGVSPLDCDIRKNLKRPTRSHLRVHRAEITDERLELLVQQKPLLNTVHLANVNASVQVA